MEEDIKRIKYILEFGKKTGIQYVLETDDEKSLNNILNELERLQKENEKLKLINQSLENTKDTCPNMATSGIRCNLKNSIPKQVIRDEIEKLEKDAEKIREKKKDAYDSDRSKSRLQAYLTKTNEIAERLKELLK